MPLYRYKAITSDGELSEGEMQAASEEVVISRLKEAGQMPVRAEEISQADTGGKKRSLVHRALVSRSHLTVLTRELARMINAGVPLDRSLTILIAVAESDAVKKLLTRLLESIRGGSTFADALETQGSPFNRMYVSMVRAGEAGGALPVVLDRLADYLEKSREFRASIGAAMIYPIILLTVSVLSLILLLTLVVPQFRRMFEESGAALPLPTEIVIGVAAWLQTYWWTLLVALLLGLILFPKLLDYPALRRAWDGFVLSLPGIGGLARKVEVARFCRTLSTLMSNGVVLLTALSIVRETLSNRIVAESIGGISDSLKAGESLSDPMLEARQFPKLACHMVRVGEETGRLEEMLLDVANIYDDEVRQSLKKLLSLLEPILILTLGVMIAGIIFSILIAILSINELAF